MMPMRMVSFTVLLLGGQVPRLDGEDHPERVARHRRPTGLQKDGAGGQHGLAVEGVVLKDRRGDLHLVAGLADQLAHLAGDQARMVLAALAEQRGYGAQNLRRWAKGRKRPSSR